MKYALCKMSRVWMCNTCTNTKWVKGFKTAVCVIYRNKIHDYGK